MHPTLESLASFIERPDAAEFGVTRKHIAVCSECRRQVQGLSNLVDTLRGGDLDVRPGGGTNGEEGDMENFVESAKRTQDKADLKAALHYAAHSAAMRGHLQAAMRTPPSASDARHWWRGLLMWRPPVWVAMPVAAAAAFALAVVVSPLVGVHDAAEPQIAAYQDDAQVRFEQAAETPPGLGFFHGATETTAPFGGMRIDYRAASGLTMSWGPIAGARDYTVNVSLAEPQGMRVVVEQQTMQPQVRFDHLTLEAQRRYQWTLSGTTAEGARFHTVGGFVLANNE